MKNIILKMITVGKEWEMLSIVTYWLTLVFVTCFFKAQKRYVLRFVTLWLTSSIVTVCLRHLSF